MRERGEDRRRRGAISFDTPDERRRVRYERRGRPVVFAQQGRMRPGWGEALPRVERRRMPACGME